VCYLDLAPLRHATASSSTELADTAWQEYHKGWTGAVLDSGVVQPGTRCHEADVSTAVGAVAAAHAERLRRGEQPPFWIIVSRHPAQVGPPLYPPVVSGDPAEPPWRASIWQATESAIRDSHGGYALPLVPCLATRGDPSFHPDFLDTATHAAAARSPSPTSMRLEPATPETAIDARYLMEACLGVLGTIQGRGAPPFPNGVSTVEVQASKCEDTTDVRIRVAGASGAGESRK
jgi:hypothetical protein